ncbi:MAG: GIY-YIG nuclease family protein [Telluria sp.]
MKSLAKTIQIFLPSGDPTGIRMAEITTRIVRVFEVPRALLAEFLKMPEASGGAVYFLFGTDNEAAKPQVYIGQTGDLKSRLLKHNKEKGFWQRAVVVLSRAESLTTTHSQYLEKLCILRAKEAGRFVIENDTKGNKLNTARPLESECEDLFETAQVLMGTLGYPTFTAPGATHKTDAEAEIFFCSAAGTDARGEYTAEGMVVLTGSKARLTVTENFKDTPSAKARQALISAGVLKQQGAHFVFTENYSFGSPSTAAAIIVGNSMNGWVTWKTKAGKTLDAVKRQTPIAT